MADFRSAETAQSPVDGAYRDILLDFDDPPHVTVYLVAFTT